MGVRVGDMLTRAAASAWPRKRAGPAGSLKNNLTLSVSISWPSLLVCLSSRLALGSRYNAKVLAELRKAFGCFGCSGPPSRIINIYYIGPNGTMSGEHPKVQNSSSTCMKKNKKAQTPKTPKTPKHPKHPKEPQGPRHPRGPHHHPTTAKTHSIRDKYRVQYRQELF